MFLQRTAAVQHEQFKDLPILLNEKGGDDFIWDCFAWNEKILYSKLLLLQWNAFCNLELKICNIEKAGEPGNSKTIDVQF